MASLKSSVTEEIRNRIIDGRIALGQQLSENLLALDLKTSRQPVREALLHLGSEGLVDIRPQRGTFVFIPTELEREHLMELRWVYEGGALRLAAKKNRPALILALQKLLTQARKALDAKDYPACKHLDQRFHDTLIEFCDNSLITANYRSIGHRVSALRYRSLVQTDRIAEAIDEHAAVAAQIEKGRLDSACNLLRRHFDNGLKAWSNSPAGT